MRKIRKKEKEPGNGSKKEMHVKLKVDAKWYRRMKTKSTLDMKMNLYVYEELEGCIWV